MAATLSGTCGAPRQPVRVEISPDGFVIGVVLDPIVGTWDAVVLQQHIESAAAEAHKAFSARHVTAQAGSDEPDRSHRRRTEVRRRDVG